MKSIYDIIDLYQELGFNVTYEEEKREGYKAEKAKETEEK